MDPRSWIFWGIYGLAVRWCIWKKVHGLVVQDQPDKLNLDKEVIFVKVDTAFDFILATCEKKVSGKELLKIH